MSRQRRFTRRTVLRTGAAATGLLGVGTGVGAAQSGECSYQVDFVAGGPNEVLGEDTDDFYGRQNRLIQYLHGDETGVTRRDTWINSLAPETRAAVTADPIHLSEGTASVGFRVAEGAERTLSLVVYTLPGGAFAFADASDQDLVDATTGTFGPGEHRLEAALPCSPSAVETTRLVASDGEPGDSFGSGVALDGSTLLVGAPDTDDGVGSAYAFTRGTDGWTQSQRIDLSVSGFQPAPLFGSDVAVDGDTAFVSSPWYILGFQSHGAVFVYERESEGGEWTRRRRLDLGENTGGQSVDLDGSTGVATGDGGTAYVFERRDGGWERAETVSIGSGEYDPAAAAVSEGAVVLGSYLEREAYAFERTDAGEWESVARFTPDEGLGSDSLFGIEVDIDGDRIVVGDPTKYEEPGAVYVYERSEAGWERTATLTVEDSSGVGGTLLLQGDRLLVGVSGTDAGTYLYREDGGTWTRERTFDRGGPSAFDGNRIAYGESTEDDGRGAVYVVEF